MYKVKTSNFVSHLLQKRTNENQDHLEEFEINIDACQVLIKPEFPCGAKVQAVRDGFGMEMGTVTCGNQNISPESTELCDACFAVFQKESPFGALTIDQMQEYVESKPLSFFERCKKFAKDHPYLTAAAIAFPVVFALMGYGANAILTPAAPERMTADNSTAPTPAPTNATAAPTNETTTQEATAQPTTQATTIAGTTPVPPVHSVSIRDRKGKEVVSVVTREEATDRSCFTKNFRTGHSAATVDLEVDNKCANPIVVSQEGSTKGCVVEPETVGSCVGEKSKKFYFYQGSNVVFVPATQANQTLSTELKPNGDLVVHLASQPANLTDSSCMQKLPLEDGVVYKNNCDKTVLFSMTKRGKTETVLVKPHQEKALDYTYNKGTEVTFGENIDLPVIEQAAKFKPSAEPSPTAPAATTTTKPATPRLRKLSVQKDASGKDVVTVLTSKKIAPNNANTTSCLIQDFSANNQTSEVNPRITNNCEQPILIAPKDQNTTLGIVLPKQNNSAPYSGSEFDFYLGSNIGFLTPAEQQENIKAYLLGNDNVLIELTSPIKSLNCIKSISTDASLNNAPRYNNTCDEPVLLSMQGQTDKWTHTQLFEAGESAALPQDQQYKPFGENKDIPTIIQKPDLA